MEKLFLFCDMLIKYYASLTCHFRINGEHGLQSDNYRRFCRTAEVWWYSGHISSAGQKDHRCKLWQYYALILTGSLHVVVKAETVYI